MEINNSLVLLKNNKIDLQELNVLHPYSFEQCLLAKTKPKKKERKKGKNVFTKTDSLVQPNPFSLSPATYQFGKQSFLKVYFRMDQQTRMTSFL